MEKLKNIVCTIDYCENKTLTHKKGYCSTHYRRWKKYGDPTKTLRPNHGLTHTKAYRSWAAAKNRVFNRKGSDYGYYGGRGITMYAPWAKNFLQFYKDVGDAPSKNHTLDRIDPNKGYEPGNVRWASRWAQSVNQRMRKDNRSGYRGVSFTKDGKWVANITSHGSQYYLGVFESAEEAALKRDSVAKKLHGELAKLNF